MRQNDVQGQGDEQSENALRGQMEKLQKQQKICITAQIVLAVLSIVLFWLAVILLFVHAAIAIFFGWILSARASALAAKEYPYVPYPVSSIGGGSSRDKLFIAEAKRNGDSLTAKIIAFRYRSFALFFGGTLGNIIMWILLVLVGKVLE